MKRRDIKFASSRREFITSTTILAAGLALGPELLAAGPARLKPGSVNEKIRMGFIGIGNRGSQLLNAFMANDDVAVTALCDIYEPYLNRDLPKVDPKFREMGMVPAMGEKLGPEVKRYKDFRRLLEDKNVDAVVIATPDHWHSTMTILALRAGKDVYVEKPLTIALKEGRDMVNAWKSSKQVVTVGLNRRGSLVYRKMAEEIRAGKLGKITVAGAARISNMSPDGIGTFRPGEPPKDFDWDAWLGPRAYRPFQYNIAPYKFRWWSDYSSQMGNWGVHYMDAIRWMLGEMAPVSITAHGGKYVLTHDGDIPDTMEVIFEFASGRIIRFSIHEACGEPGAATGEIELNGTKGSLAISENGYEIIPSVPGQFQHWDQPIEPEKFSVRPGPDKTGVNVYEDPASNLIRNFLDCVKSREATWCPLEEGHRSTSFAHLANIALKRKKRLEWDPGNERFTNDEAANDELSYKYRKEWDLL